MKIDAHHHFWRYTPDEFGWIGEDMAAIRRDFQPDDLAAEIAAAGIDGVIAVQARQSIEETETLLRHAGKNPFIRGVVGWVPLVSPDAQRELETFAVDPTLRGVRHVLHDEPDDFYMLRDDFNAGIRELRRFGLAYDLLIFERHLPQTIRFVDRHPDQVFVLDHNGKPRIAAGELEPWAAQLRELARRENVFCKVSGLVTEANWSWSPAQLRPYVETVLGAFGPARTMFGSDWPVCLVACSYRRWVETVQAFARELSPSEQARIFGGTATTAYGLVPMGAGAARKDQS